MTKIKLESVNGNTFMVAGKAYVKGDYEVSYAPSGNGGDGILSLGTEALVTLRHKSGGYVFEQQNYNNFLDFEGEVYADFDTFTKALVGMIAKPGTLVGFVEAGDDVSIAGTGTEADPYIFNSTFTQAAVIDVADDFADDEAAETGLVPVGGLYHTEGAVKVRLV